MLIICFFFQGIRSLLLDSDNHECPSCKETEVSPDTLIPNRFLRLSVTKFKNETLAAIRPATDEKKVAEAADEKTEESPQTNDQKENETNIDPKMETDFDKDSDKDKDEESENEKDMMEESMENDNDNDEDKVKIKVKDEDDEEDSDKDEDKDKSDESRNNGDHDMESENENENNKNENNKNESENENEKVKDEDDNTNDSRTSEPIKLSRVSCTSLNYSVSNLLNLIKLFTKSRQTTRFAFAQATSRPIFFACRQAPCYIGTTTITRIGPFCLMKQPFSTIQCNHLLRWECQCSTEGLGRKCGTICFPCSTIEVHL